MVKVILTDPEMCDGTYYLSLTPDQKSLLDFLEEKCLLCPEIQIQTVDFEIFQTIGAETEY